MKRITFYFILLATACCWTACRPQQTPLEAALEAAGTNRPELEKGSCRDIVGSGFMLLRCYAATDFRITSGRKIFLHDQSLEKAQRYVTAGEQKRTCGRAYTLLIGFEEVE